MGMLECLEGECVVDAGGLAWGQQTPVSTNFAFLAIGKTEFERNMSLQGEVA
jgi:hypothetical protein